MIVFGRTELNSKWGCGSKEKVNEATTKFGVRKLTLFSSTHLKAACSPSVFVAQYTVKRSGFGFLALTLLSSFQVLSLTGARSSSATTMRPAAVEEVRTTRLMLGTFLAAASTPMVMFTTMAMTSSAGLPRERSVAT